MMDRAPTQHDDDGPVMKPAISVVMPAFNAGAYLLEAVESILGQTERDFELILINDGSADATHEIAQELCARDSRIRYFSQENSGIVATLNRGLDLCRGEFIARMDADDIAHSRRFEKQLQLLQQNPQVVICGSDALMIGKASGRLRKPRSDRACRAWLLIGPCFVHPSVMFRRSVIDRGLRYRAACEYAEDYDFWFQIAALGQLRNLREPLLSYRFHGAQLTSTKRQTQCSTHVDIATAQLAGQGIRIDKRDFHAILWPEQSNQPGWRILLSAWSLFLRMMVRRNFAPYLMLGTSWNILRHKAPFSTL